MKLAFKTDDVGYSHVHNLGTFEAVDNGVVTHLDIMLDCKEGTDEALEFAKNHAWLSTGWHAHFWGWPILPKEEVSSMLTPEGRFKGRSNRWNNPERSQMDYEECRKECIAEMNNCVCIMGRTLDFGGSLAYGNLPITRAVYDTARDFGLMKIYVSRKEEDKENKGSDMRHFGETPNLRNAYYNQDMDHGFFYDPYTCFEKAFTEEMLKSDTCYICGYHAAYVDPLVMKESSLTLGRIKDVEFLTSDWLKDYIIRNKIELVSIKDAVLGSQDYQNHLRQINSPLWIGNM